MVTSILEGRDRFASPDPALSLEEMVRRLESREIRRALDESGGMKSKAARALGITNGS